MASHRSAHRRATLLVGSCLYLVVSVGTAAGQTDSTPTVDESLKARVTQLAQPYIEHGLVVGMSIGVIQGDQQATAHLGRANESDDRPNDDTIYEIASVSKVFTGILLADAVTRKELRLDQPVQELLPQGVTMPSWQDSQITLLQMATHRSGLPRLSNNMPSLQSDNPYADYTSKLAHEFLNQHKLQRKPGEKMEYSNFAFALLGHLLSQRAGVSYDELLQQRLTVPLGMDATRVDLTGELRARLATPHQASGEATSTWEFADMPGAGGIHSSIDDMLRFAKANLDPPQGELASALDLAWTKHQDAAAGELAMGLGWHIAQDGSTRWHNGQTGGFHTMIMVNRQVRGAVVILSNSAVMDIDQLAGQIIMMLAGGKVEPRQFPEAVKISPQQMKQLEGRYQLAPNFVFTVKVQGDKLMVGVTNQPTLQVFPKSETEWFYKVVDASLTFKKNKDGTFDTLELFQNGVRQPAKRIE